MRLNLPDRRTYALLSLGCVKNLVDSERMAGLLAADGFRLVERPEGAGFALVNTCGFIGDARDESYGVIEEMVALKRAGRLGGIIVAGCLAERDRQKLLERFPEVDRIVGVFAREEIAAAARRLAEESADQRVLLPPPWRRAPSDLDRLRLTARHVAFVKIAEGCSRSCAFCTIPKLRGPFVSKPIEAVVAEAQRLAADGARELVLIAQDTSNYGVDLEGRPRLADLLRRLEAVEGLAWIRLMYLYPTQLDDELIDAIAGSAKVLPYLDLPLQHCNDEILRRMRRGIDRSGTQRLIDRLRERIEGLVLRTTMLVGFPGETEEHFEELLDFVRRQRFERMGAFAYSNEPGTPAEGLDGRVPEPEARRRRDALMAAQQEIAFEFARRQVGLRLDVLIDRDIPGRKDAYVGRWHADAPEIDAAVYVTGRGLGPGRLVPCEIVAARRYDLVGAAL
jgi:ribosomal protein S12 methylthiotransferase